MASQNDRVLHRLKRRHRARRRIIEWMVRTALGILGQASLGYSFDPLVHDSVDEYANVVESFKPALPLYHPPLFLVC